MRKALLFILASGIAVAATYTVPGVGNAGIMPLSHTTETGGFLSVLWMCLYCIDFIL